MRVILERILSLDPTVSKQVTGDNLGNDRAGPVSFLGDVRQDAVDHDSIIASQWPPEDRTSKELLCEKANADHKGKYLARWMKDFRATVNMAFYYFSFWNNPIGKLLGHL